MSLRPAIAALALLTASATTASSQGQATPELYRTARAQLEGADTAAALTSLRELTEELPDYAPGWGLLGEVLTAKASGVATEFVERMEADQALRRALKLDPGNPVYLLALGQLMRKQQIYLDARRMLNRAINALEERPDAVPAEERAELWYQRALFWEDQYLDTRHLVYAPDVPVAGSCAMSGPNFCLNFTRPERFNEYFRHVEDISQFGQDDFEHMEDLFRRALDANPAHAGAFRRLAIHLIDRGDLAGARALVRRYREAAPDNPWGDLVLGLTYHRMGNDSLAQLAFERGLELASSELRSHYRDVSTILTEDQAERYSVGNEMARQRIEQVLWEKSDPLYLSSENEVRVSHMARMTYADLMFEDLSRGVWGSETERGVIYVRYGAPKHIWQLQRDARKELSPSEAAALQRGEIQYGASKKGGGRWILWNYGWELPNFIFQKQLRYRYAYHTFDSYSKVMEQEVREKLPANYEMSFSLVGYPVQWARFRGAADSVVELDVYSRVPTDTLLAVVDADSIEAGVFLFTSPQHQQLYRRTLRVPAAPGGRALTYTLPLLAGDYTLSLEARTLDGGAAAVRRSGVELERFPDDQLSLSDIVIAETVVPRIDDPTGRRDFAIQASQDLEFEVYDPIALYWEVYGLTPDDEGLARYQVALRVTGGEGRGVAARVLSALGEAFGLSGGDDGPELSYERVVELRGVERVPEYLSLELATDEPGTYRVQLQVTDQVSGAVFQRERTFRVVGEPTDSS